MDLNELFYRQQIERSLAARAGLGPVCKIHEELASTYETMINRTSGNGRPLFIWSDAVAEPTNAIMAIAITAREVGVHQVKA